MEVQGGKHGFHIRVDGFYFRAERIGENPQAGASANADYLLFNKGLEALKHEAFEEHQIVLVVACIQAAMHSGYHTTVETALKMSDGKPRF